MMAKQEKQQLHTLIPLKSLHINKVSILMDYEDTSDLERYMVGVDGNHGFTHRGQGDLYGSGEDATLASAPSLPNAKSNKYVIKQPQQMKNPAPTGGKNIIKQGLDLSLNPLSVDMQHTPNS